MGALGKNTQNQLRAVDDGRSSDFFQIALLLGRNFIIENHNISMMLAISALISSTFPFPMKVAGS